MTTPVFTPRRQTSADVGARLRALELDGDDIAANLNAIRAQADERAAASPVGRIVAHARISLSAGQVTTETASGVRVAAVGSTVSMAFAADRGAYTVLVQDQQDEPALYVTGAHTSQGFTVSAYGAALAVIALNAGAHRFSVLVFEEA